MTTASTRQDDKDGDDDEKPTEGGDGAAAVPQTVVKPRQSRKRRAVKNAIRVALGLGLGLCIAEAAFWFRDGGSFPHLNIYVEDSDRGVRLRPGATERIRFSKNPITHIRINEDGYRGASWPQPSPSTDEIVVVGDSQVLGLGVEENETFSAALQTSLGNGTLVRNLGVPTYGPPEYNGLIEEALTKRPAKTVIYVVNLANDLFEAKRRNTERHAVWDGWAVRKETAPPSIHHFPGRELLFRDSHAVFALRGWLYGRGEKVSEQGFASEGTWQDIGNAALTAQTDHSGAEAESQRLAKLREVQIKYANDRANNAASSLDRKVVADAPSEDLHDANADWDNPNYVPKSDLLEASRMSPGDILVTGYGENSRDVTVNAEQIRRGALLRVALEKKVKAQAEAKHDKEVLGLFDERDATAKKAGELKSAPPPKVVAMSPLAPLLRDAKSICDRHGARLVVMVLPIDVQVSKNEWTKYGVAPVDMAETKILNSDVAVAAEVAGADAFDAFETLREAEPGAFLDGDLHMTPKGHKAVGEALAKVLRAPKVAAVAMPREGLPPSRTWLPQPNEWNPKTEIAVRESDPAGCETKRLREYIGIFCRHKPIASNVVVTSGTDVLAGAVPGGSMLIAPVIAGQDLKATFAYEGASRDFIVKVTDLPENADVGFTKPLPARPDIAGAALPPETDAFCKCFIDKNPGKTCTAASALPDPDCNRTYGSDCTKLLACSMGDPSTVATCTTGFVHAGAAQHCKAVCSTDPKNVVSCKTGRCTSWQGGEVCM